MRYCLKCEAEVEENKWLCTECENKIKDSQQKYGIVQIRKRDGITVEKENSISIIEKDFIEKNQPNYEIQIQPDYGFYSLVMVVVFIIGGFIPLQYTVINMLIKAGIAFGCPLAGIVFGIWGIKAEYSQKAWIGLLIHTLIILYFIVLVAIFLPAIFKTAGY